MSVCPKSDEDKISLAPVKMFTMTPQPRHATYCDSFRLFLFSLRTAVPTTYLSCDEHPNSRTTTVSNLWVGFQLEETAIFSISVSVKYLKRAMWSLCFLSIPTDWPYILDTSDNVKVFLTPVPVSTRTTQFRHNVHRDSYHDRESQWSPCKSVRRAASLKEPE